MTAPTFLSVSSIRSRHFSPNADRFKIKKQIVFVGFFREAIVNRAGIALAVLAPVVDEDGHRITTPSGCHAFDQIGNSYCHRSTRFVDLRLSKIAEARGDPD